MTSLLSIIRKRTGDTTTAGQEHWLKGLEKSDRRGSEAGRDPNATESDCPYIKGPYRIVGWKRFAGCEMSKTPLRRSTSSECLSMCGLACWRWSGNDFGDNAGITDG